MKNKGGGIPMESKHLWTKTMLSVYKYLERICDAIDKICISSALSSSNILGQNYFSNNVHAISQKLINLGQRKITLINLKLLTEDVLSKLKESDANLLIEKYIDERKTKDIAVKNNLSLRSAFRKIALAEEAFDRKLNVMGYDDKKISNMLKEETWINNVFNTLSQNDKDISIGTKELERAVK